MQNVADSIRNLVGKVGGLSLPVKLLVGVLIGILSGSGFLGGVSEYAAYFYALRSGFRPPLEGLPYLRAIVTLLSFVLLLLAALFTVTVHSAFEKVPLGRSGTTNSDDDTALTTPSEGNHSDEYLSRPRVVLVAIVVSLFSGLLFFVAHRLAPFEADVSSSISTAIAVAMIIFLFFMIQDSVRRKPSLAWWYVAATALAVLIGGPALFLNHTFYSQFLRFTGYGGGLVVTVQVDSQGDRDDPMTYSGGLLLRTSESVFLYVHDDSLTADEVIEVPLTKVRAISHAAAPFHERASLQPVPTPIQDWWAGMTGAGGSDRITR